MSVMMPTAQRCTYCREVKPGRYRAPSELATRSGHGWSQGRQSVHWICGDCDVSQGTAPKPDFECLLCGNIEQDDEFFPYCSASCVRAADGESDEDENPRERGDDDGVEFSDPRDYRDGRE